MTSWYRYLGLFWCLNKINNNNNNNNNDDDDNNDNDDNDDNNSVVSYQRGIVGYCKEQCGLNEVKYNA